MEGIQFQRDNKTNEFPFIWMSKRNMYVGALCICSFIRSFVCIVIAIHIFLLHHISFFHFSLYLPILSSIVLACTITRNIDCTLFGSFGSRYRHISSKVSNKILFTHRRQHTLTHSNNSIRINQLKSKAPFMR